MSFAEIEIIAEVSLKQKTEKKHNFASLIQAELVRIVFAFIPLGVPTLLINVVTLAYIIRDTVPDSLITYWLLYMLPVNLAFLFLGIRFRLRPLAEKDYPLWERYFVIFSALVGIGWGLSALLFYPRLDGMERTIHLMMLAGVTAGGAASVSTIYPAYLLFNLLSLIPLIIMAVIPPFHGAIAFLTCLYMVFMLYVAKRYSNTIYTALSLRFEKDELVDELSEEVSHRRKAESELKEKEASLESAQRIANLGNWEWFVDNDRFVLSQQMRVLLDLSEDERNINHERYLSCVYEEDRTILINARAEAASTGESYRCEYRLKSHYQHKRTVEEFGEVAKGSNGLVLSAAVLDISERKSMDRIKDEFISTVSHELRTPLTSISGSLGLLQGGLAGELPEKASSLIETADRNSRRLVNLVNDILDINKLEFGDLPLSLTEVDVSEMVREALKENRGYAGKLSVTLQLVEDIPPCIIKADEDRLIQVMTNLLSNAAKYSPEGGCVDIMLRKEESTVWIGIKDRGPGIDEDFKPLLFEKFTQGNASDSRYQYGTGLGLNISKLIIEKHGGEIGVDSTPGEGSCFYFRLPYH